MCNINLVYNVNNVNKRLISYVMNAMSYSSWKMNDDGEGFIGFSTKYGMTMGRSLNKLLYDDAYYCLATHQRLKTSGSGVNNIHPHPTDNLVLMHNGIISGLGDDEKSDTRMYLNTLDNEYCKNGMNIVSAIKKVSKETSGSYSILVFEKKSGKLYYYKNQSTSMYMMKQDDWIVMSTNQSNVEYARFALNLDANIKEFKSGVIYDVFEGLIKVGKFKPKSNVYSYNNSNYNKKDWSMSLEDKSIEDVDDYSTLSKEDFNNNRDLGYYGRFW